MKTLQNLKDTALKNRSSYNVLRLASNVADTETITIGGEVYEIDTAADPGAITAGRIRVNCNAGVTPAVASVEIVKTINNNSKQRLIATRISDNELLLECLDGTPFPCAETLAGLNNQWAAADMWAGSPIETPRQRDVQTRAITATEVALTNVRFVFPFTVNHFIAACRTTAGVAKAIDGAQTKTGRRVDIAIGTLIAGDILSVVASS